MTPGMAESMTANVKELVFRRCGGFLTLVGAEGTTVELEVEDGAKLSAGELAAALRADGLVSAEAKDLRTVLARFTDATTAANASLESFRLAVGDFEVATFKEDELLTLRRIRSAAGFAQIEFLNFATEDEEWRRFLGDEIDLIPSISPQQEIYLREDPTVRLVSFSHPPTTALYLRTDSPTLADPQLRRAISLALDRRAIASVVNGNSTTAIEVKEDLDEARTILGRAGYSLDRPLKLTFRVVSEASDFQRAALVVEQQLAVVEIEIDFEVMTGREVQQRLGDRYDGIVFTGGWDREYAFALPYLSKYVNAELDAAVAAGKDELVRSILERDVPLTPLYHVEQSIAADADLCNIHPRTLSDPLWLADIRPCADGEVE